MLPAFLAKYKRQIDVILLPLIVILVGVGAFGLGRLSSLEAQKGALIIHAAGVALQSGSGQASTTEVQ